MAWNLSSHLRAHWLRGWKRPQRKTIFRSQLALEQLEDRNPPSSILLGNVVGGSSGASSGVSSSPGSLPVAAAAGGASPNSATTPTVAAASTASGNSSGNTSGGLASTTSNSFARSIDPFSDPFADPFGSDTSSRLPKGGGGGSSGGFGGSAPGDGGGAPLAATPATGEPTPVLANSGSSSDALWQAVNALGVFSSVGMASNSLAASVTPQGGATASADTPIPFIAGTLDPQALQRFAAGSVRFEPNVGQGQRGTAFTSSDLGYQLGLTTADAVFTLGPPTGKPNADPVSLDMHFIGTNPNAQLSGEQLLPGQTNYYLGRNFSQNVAATVPGYAQVQVQDLYPGVDLVYYSTANRGLEYDLRIAPGVDPGVIQLSFSGAQSMTLNGQGDLVLHTAAGEVTEQAPQFYQNVGGVRQSVAGQYTLSADGQLGVRPGNYDPTLPLIIDPVLGYSSPPSLGSYIPTSVAVDGSGNLYMTGLYAAYSGAPTDVFVRQLSADGSTVNFTTVFGGSDNETAPSLTVANGNVYVVGTTASSDFPVLNAYQSSNAGGTDAFLATFDAGTGARTESTYLGGTGDDAAKGVAVDSSGHLFVAGDTGSTSFPTASTVLGTQGGGRDAFLSEFNSSASSLLASAFVGGSGDETTSGLALDSSGNVYLAGVTTSTDLPVTAGAFQQRYGGGTNDGFVAKILADDSAFGYVTYLGGAGSDQPTALAVDRENSVYVVGATTSNDYPIVNPYQTGGTGAFITKLNPSGDDEVYSTTLGTSAATATGVAVDSQGRALVTGSTGGVGVAFPTLNPLAAPNGTDDGAYLSMLTLKVRASFIPRASAAPMSTSPRRWPPILSATPMWPARVRRPGWATRWYLPERPPR